VPSKIASAFSPLLYRQRRFLPPKNSSPQTKTSELGSGTEDCTEGFSRNHVGGAHFAMCDGSVRFIEEDVSFNNAKNQIQYNVSFPGLCHVDWLGVYTLNGEPLKDALVQFQPQLSDGSPSYGSTDQAGQYEMFFSQQKKGALIGEHLVQISTSNENEHIREKLPPKYRADSTIIKTVVAGETNVINFEIVVDPE